MDWHTTDERRNALFVGDEGWTLELVPSTAGFKWVIRKDGWKVAEFSMPLAVPEFPASEIELGKRFADILIFNWKEMLRSLGYEE